MADITMPQLGETVVEGTIIKWFKKVGDPVAKDETLFEVSTDKVDSEVPSVAEGFLAEILVAEGETVDVGTRLAVVTEAEPAAGGSSAPSPSEEEAGATDGSPGDDPGAAPVETTGAETAGAGTAPAEAGSDEDQGAGPEPEPAPAPGPPAASTGESPPRREGGATLLSPVVRRLIAEHDLDAADIPGTGQSGRVTRADVLAFIDQGAVAAKQGPKPPSPAARRPAPAPTAAPAAAAKPTPARPGEDDTVVPFSNIRRRTAEHMVRSQATSAHVLTVTEIDFAAVDRVRRAMRDDFKAKEGFSLTYLPFVSRAVVDAIAEFPDVNASVGDNTLIIHNRVHLGFAVDLAHEGLIVPVVRDAHGKRLSAIARDLAALAARARSHDLTAPSPPGPGRMTSRPTTSPAVRSPSPIRGRSGRSSPPR